MIAARYTDLMTRGCDKPMLQNLMIRFFNLILPFFLRSRWHGAVSKDIVLIQFTGRKSGRVYTTPVSYIQDGDVVKIFTDANGKWWKNFQHGAPIKLWLQGREVQGTGEAVTDHAKIVPEVKDFLERVPRDASLYGIKLDQNGSLSLDAAAHAAEDTVMIRIQLAAE